MSDQGDAESSNQGSGAGPRPGGLSGNQGCLTAIVVVFGGVGWFLIAWGTSDDMGAPCKRYPGDGYCSLQEIVIGAGWVLASIALITIGAWAVSAVRASNRRNSIH